MFFGVAIGVNFGPFVNRETCLCAKTKDERLRSLAEKAEGALESLAAVVFWHLTIIAALKCLASSAWDLCCTFEIAVFSWSSRRIWLGDCRSGVVWCCSCSVWLWPCCELVYLF